MVDILVLAVIALILGLAAGYIRREKKKGSPCVGCPYGSACASRNGGAGCSANKEK